MFLPYNSSLIKTNESIEKIAQLNADQNITPVIIGTRQLMAHHVERVGKLVELVSGLTLWIT